MTRISYIHGIPANENADRGKTVGVIGNYIPYNSLTVGETRLLLLRDRLAMFSMYYPEMKELRAGVTLINNALNAGVSRGVSFIGAIGDELQDVARLIVQASDQTAPAVRGGYMGRHSIYTGIGDLGEKGDYITRLKHCVASKGADPNAIKPNIPIGNKQKEWEKRVTAEAVCKQRLEFEDLLNAKMLGMGHHMLYKNVDVSFPGAANTVVRTKHQLQVQGVKGLADLAEFTNIQLMYDWLENGVYSKNMVGGVGSINSVQSSFMLAPDPNAAFTAYIAQNPATRAKWEKLNPGIQGIGILPVAIPIITALIGLLTKAVDLARDLIAKAREKQSLALAEADGFGTAEYKSEQSDWNTPASGGGIDQNTLLLGAAGVAAWMLMSDSK